MKHNRIKIYLLLLTAICLLWTGIASVGTSLARYNDTVTVDLLLSDAEEIVTSDCLVSNGTQMILLDPLSEGGRVVGITLLALRDTTEPLIWTMDENPYINVRVMVSEGPGVLHDDGTLELPAGTETVLAIMLTPTELADEGPREEVRAELEVSYGALHGTFCITLPAFAEQEKPDDDIEPPEPEENEPESPEEVEPTGEEPEPAEEEQAEPDGEIRVVNTELSEQEPAEPTEEPTQDEELTESTDPTETTEPETEESTESSEPAGEDETEPTAPPAGEPEEEMPVTDPAVNALAGVRVDGKIPLILEAGERADAIRVGVPGEEGLMPLPKFTRYMCNGTRYLMYDGGYLELNPRSCAKVWLEADRETTVLAVEESLNGALTAQYTVNLNADAVEAQDTGNLKAEMQQQTAERPLILEQPVWKTAAASQANAYLEVDFPVSWLEIPDLKLEYAVEMLTMEEDAVSYVPVEPKTGGLDLRYISDLQKKTHTMEVHLQEELPPAGTYRLMLNWYCDGVCIHTEQKVFFVRYTPENQ